MSVQTRAATVRVPPGPNRSEVRKAVLNRLRGKAADRLELFAQLRNYGDIVYFQLTPKLKGYVLFNPEYIRYVLVDAPDKFHKGPSLRRQAADTLSKGLLLSEGEFHKRQRKLAQPAFHYNRIMTYGDVMVRYTERLIGHWHDGQTLDVHEAMMHLTMEIVAKTLFDADVSEDASAIGEAMTVSIRALNKRILTPLNLPRWVPTPENRAAKRAADTITQTVMQFIEERRASGEDKGDLLSMLLLARDEETGESMSDEQTCHEVRTLFAAGHETTANALAWSWYLLGEHPEALRKLQEELDQVLQGRPPTLQALAQLPYTEQVIKESMRLYPPAWVMNRQAIEDVQIGGYEIPKGSLVFFSQYAMHRHPTYFAQPDAFIPERWTAEFEKNLPKYAYFPFGGGPRVCIGQQFAMMEARLILASIAQRWSMTVPANQVIETEPLITLRPRHGIQVLLHAR